jgi:hypothetical protein
MAFYAGAATVHSLVKDCFKRAIDNRRDSEGEREMFGAALADVRACLVDVFECVNDAMSQLQGDTIKQFAALPDNAEALEIRQRLAEMEIGRGGNYSACGPGKSTESLPSHD